MDSPKSENCLLNGMKLIASFFVVFIHIKFPLPFGETVKGLARFAVPFFFMISGFYFWSGDFGKMKFMAQKRSISTAKLLLPLNLLYLTCELAKYWYKIGFPLDYFRSILTIKQLAKWLVFNNPPWAGVLWYLHSLLYVYVFYYILLRFRNKLVKTVTMLAPLLLLSHILLALAQYTAENPFPYHAIVLRNAYFDAFPFFAVGCIIKIYQQQIHNYLCKINNIYILLILLMTVQVLEGLQFNGDVYISTIPLSTILFILTEANHRAAGPSILSEWGKKHSAMIYFIHSLWITAFNFLSERIRLYGAPLSDMPLYGWLAPILVCISSLIFSIAFSAFMRFIFLKLGFPNRRA